VLAPGQSFTVKVSVTVRPAAARGNQLAGLLLATSNTTASKKDAVKFIAKRS
jgi:hypothetical protein